MKCVSCNKKLKEHEDGDICLKCLEEAVETFMFDSEDYLEDDDYFEN